MMSSAQRDRELVTDLAAESAVLREPEMMRVARLTPTDQTGLLGDIAHVIAIANAPRLRMHEHCLINRLCRGSSFPVMVGPCRVCVLLTLWISFGAMKGKAQKLGPKRLLYMLWHRPH
jgi:hypothetical protein